MRFAMPRAASVLSIVAVARLAAQAPPAKPAVAAKTTVAAVDAWVARHMVFQVAVLGGVDLMVPSPELTKAREALGEQAV